MDQKNDYLYDLRHSAAHLLAQAVTELFPGTKLTIGPVTEFGFFYDFLPTANFKEADLERIEQRMHELSAKNYAITGKQMAKDEARPLFANNQFKQELIDTIDAPTVGVYWQGDFYDLCKGGHVEAIGEIKHFKLTGISGAYWRGDRSGTALQRISGVAFATKEDLDAYLQRIEDAQKYDHRVLGRQLDLFSFHDESPGVPFIHPKGLLLYNGLINYLRKLYGNDYQEIRTPQLMHEQLWHTSGHFANYKDHMYMTQVEESNFCMRPMNCPGSILFYNIRPRSYRELPLRLAEFGFVHRFELSGVLHGLMRVRGFTQDDAHHYCTIDQVEQEVADLLKLAQKIYKDFGFTEVQMALSTRPEKAMGSEEVWTKAIAALRSAMEKQGIAYKLQEGEGAFYGPKIEMKIKDTMGREWQCGTIQVDFVQPDNFDLTYVDADQSRKRPVMIHRALLGSIERFIGILLEHTKGQLPFWLAPVQARLLVVTDGQRPYATTVAEQLRAAGLRVEVDDSGDQLGAQIRRAQVDKVPWMLVLGKKEAEAGTVTLRQLDGSQQQGLVIAELVAKARELEPV